MAENWAKAFQSGQMIRAEIAREILEQNGVAAVIVDKKDSSYPVFGMYEVHVPASDLLKAQTIITNEGALKESE
jgi:F420-0:gamma-glutamyl ligase-like protein